MNDGVSRTAQDRISRRILFWTLGVGVIVAIGIYVRPESPVRIFGAPARGFPRVPGPPPNLRALLSAFGVGSLLWYATAVAVPFLLWRARRLSTERGWARIALLAAGVILACTAITVVTQYTMVFRGLDSPPPLTAYMPAVAGQHVLMWSSVLALVGVIESRRRSVQSVIERERLRAQVAEQRLIALTGQLQPHFLFNTLQGISTLMHRDADAADEMLSKLSDLLRELLRQRDRPVVSLADELRYARTYLEISRIRFVGRLEFEIDAPADLLNAAVPLFILQPLIENAVRHGIGGRIEGGRITVRARRDGTDLRLEVIDDGAGIPANRLITEGIGISNTRERLLASYGKHQHLTIESGAGKGVIARIDMPLESRPA